MNDLGALSESSIREPAAFSAFASVTSMTDEERTRMFDLAGKGRSEVAPDLPDYIMSRDYVSAALRTARELGADQSDWEEMIAALKKRKG